MRVNLGKMIGTAIVATFVVAGTGCLKESTQEKGAKTQEKLMQRAQEAYPVPETENFRTRKAVVKWMERMDTPDKVFYIYLLADNGQKIGYYIGKTRPISVCTFLTPPDREIDVRGGPNPLGTAPALDGVWYKGGGCEQEYFFDAQTNAMHSIKGMDYLVSDQPLSVDVEPLSVTTIEDVQNSQ